MVIPLWYIVQWWYKSSIGERGTGVPKETDLGGGGGGGGGLGDSSLLGLGLAGDGLLFEELGLGSFGLADVDGLDENALVLVHVALGLHVEVVVDVLVDLVGLAELAKEGTEHTLTRDPEHLLRHAGLTSTTTLAETSVTTLALGKEILADASTRMHSDRLLDDQTIINQLANSTTTVGKSNLIALIRVKPHTVLAALGNRRRKPLLQRRHLASRSVDERRIDFIPLFFTPLSRIRLHQYIAQITQYTIQNQANSVHCKVYIILNTQITKNRD